MHSGSVRLFLAVILAGIVWVRPQAAHAICVGDCNSDGEVSIDELILGVNIALGSAALSSCPTFDADDSGDVTIDEIIAAVSNALNSCPMVSPTPTVSAQMTPTPTVSSQPTSTPPAGCGNGIVEFNLGETCDDGNTVDGDSCPANCRIATCTASGSTVDVDVSFSPPSGVDLDGLTVFLRYPDGTVRIPGSANDPAVQDRVVNLPDNSFTTLNDLDYGLRAAILSPDQSAFTPGLLFTVNFDACQGANRPSASAFRCIVENAADTNAATVEGATCSVAVQQ
ncbi:MAG TPA: hypothetical protein VMT89_07025 [Candidatus Acidoferrales bacterium]|nr:hypothetical protein [Candidatus Acidoferrales bacterium]